MTSDSDPVQLQSVSTSVRVVTLDRPAQSNALDPPLHRAVVAALRQARLDPDVHAVVLTGAGDAFSAGGDLGLIRQMQVDDSVRSETLALARELFTELTTGIPVIAAVNGPAVGAGCTLALACDVVFMADDTFLADPHIRLGLVPGDGGAALWPMLTSLSAAKAYLLTGDRLPAPEAFRLGLVHRLAARSNVVTAAVDFAERVARLPAGAVAETKRALGLHLVSSAAAVFDAALAAEDRSFDSPEHQALTARSVPDA